CAHPRHPPGLHDPSPARRGPAGRGRRAPRHGPALRRARIDRRPPVGSRPVARRRRQGLKAANPRAPDTRAVAPSVGRRGPRGAREGYGGLFAWLDHAPCQPGSGRDPGRDHDRDMPHTTRLRHFLPRHHFLLLLLLASLLAACAGPSPHWVADRREELRRAIVEGRVDDAERLADQHAAVLGPALGLDLSVRHGEVPAIRRFLASHPVNEPIDASGTTALMRAATDTPTERGPEVIALLLQAGADAEQADYSGRSAIDYVRDRRNDPMIAAMRRGSAAAAAALIEPVTPVRWLPSLEATPARPPEGGGKRR